MEKCFRCGKEKEVTTEYGKPVCRECAPAFKIESKKEVEEKIEEFFLNSLFQRSEGIFFLLICFL